MIVNAIVPSDLFRLGIVLISFFVNSSPIPIVFT